MVATQQKKERESQKYPGFKTCINDISSALWEWGGQGCATKLAVQESEAGYDRVQASGMFTRSLLAIYPVTVFGELPLKN